MVFNKSLHNFQTTAFSFIVGLTWLLYILIALGLSATAPQYLDYLHSFVKIYVSLFLIYRFTPFRRIKLTNLDTRIAFSAGIFLLATTAIDGLLKNYIQKIIHISL